MSWLNGLSQSEQDEIYLDACEAFTANQIDEREFREVLNKLGYNATDTEDCVKQYRPPTPEGRGD